MSHYTGGMDTRSSLLREIETFVRRHGIAETTFGRMSVNDGKFVGRLRAGGGVGIDTVQKVREFIAKGMQKPKKAKAAS